MTRYLKSETYIVLNRKAHEVIKRNAKQKGLTIKAYLDETFCRVENGQ